MRKKLELIVTYNGHQEILEVSERPIMIGDHPSCQIKTQSDDARPASIKAVLQNESDNLKVKIFSKEYALELGGKKYKSAIFKDSVYFKLGPVDIVLNVSDIQEEPKARQDNADSLDDLDDLQDYSEHVPSEFVAETTSPLLPARPPIESERQPEAVASSENEKALSASDSTQAQEEPPHKGPAQIVAQTSESESSVRAACDESDLEAKFFSFSTVFDESHYEKKNDFSYRNGKFDFSGYIDPEDETLSKLPTDNFLQQTEDESVHIAHVHNGTTLTDRYYPLERKKVFISNKKDGKTFFPAHDWSGQKDELFHNRNGKTIVVRLDGYQFQKVTQDERLIDLSGQTTILNKDERIILSNETSQIVVQLSQRPPSLKKDSPLDIDEKLLKILACVWAFFLVPMLGIMMLVDLPEKQDKPKELVVILKRKQAPSKKASASSSSGSKSPATQKSKEPQKTAAKKAPSKAKKKVAKTPPKKAPQKKVRKKVASKPKAAPAKTAPRKVVAKSAPKAKSAPVKKAATVAKAAKKTYSFNSASKMKNLLGGNLRGLAGGGGSGEKVEVSVSSAVGTNTIKNEAGAGLGSVSHSVSRLATSGAGSGQAAMGSRGLSGKTGTDTTYAEGNAKVLGSLDPNLIRKIMREYIPQFRYCYQKELMKDEQVAGVFDLNFYIDRYGKGIKVSVDSQGKGFSRSGVGCLQKVVSMIKFPKPPGGNLVDVKQPLNFQQNRKAAGSF